MSTYLQLCRKLRMECGIAGGSSIPMTVVGQSGVLEKLVAWVNDSWRDIQLRHPNWRWMKAYFTLNTVNGTDTYAYGACTDVSTSSPISRFRRWWAHDRLNPFKCYLTSQGQAGEWPLIYLPFESWRAIYKFGPQASQTGQPTHVSVDDADRIVLGPNPNGVYTVTGSYQRGVQVLVADGDTPDMPPDFHDLIVYLAMMRYAANSVAPEVLARARLEANRLMRALEASQLPSLRIGLPLA